MSFEAINESVEKLTCELVLSDSQDLTSISGLLPILKKIHSQCMEQSLKSEAKQILKAKSIIKEILNDDSQNNDQNFSDLENLISDFSKTIQGLEPVEQETESEENLLDEHKSPDQDEEKSPDQMDELQQIEKKLDEFSALIAAFCPGEIPDLGAMLNNLDELINISEGIEPTLFYQISKSCKGYVENMTLEDIHNIRPVEKGLGLLISIMKHLKMGKQFGYDYSDVLELLEPNLIKEQQPEVIEPEEQEPVAVTQTEPEKIPDNDLEILIDFISEAEENLDTIEINLVELEQDPSNSEIINDIFRPFHTIKGVSGFLSLTKINKLAHATENLLDSARSGDFIINQNATDVILESVDTLKILIDRLRLDTETGFKQPDDDIPVDALRKKLQQLQVSLARGDKEAIGEILVKKKAVDQDSLDQALEIQKTNPDKKIGEILVEEKKVQPKQVASALKDQSHQKKKIDAQVKVSTSKLDDLVDYAGELVIAQSMLRQKISDDPSLNQTVAQLGLIVNNMQTIAMSMRMIPIKATFMKMIRLIRDLSRKSGKDVNLSMFGEDTEIDRNVVDALYEPMVHMIRNSVDHGIESLTDRGEVGKPSQGNVYLRAYHKGGNIVIEIEDDGKGLDKNRILEKAKSTGLISGSEQMTDAQIYDLIMQPGFSTAKEITDVSGRGVGMDVVNDGIEKFRGHLDIESEYGKGTKFTISLPLTLAIIDGMLVRVDDEKYIIPTIATQKAFKPGEDEYFTVEGKGEMVKDRGSLIPLIRLNEIYGSSNQIKAMKDCLVVVVESKDEKRALLIDELLGKDEYVIKNLGSSMEDVQGVAGGAILSDGRVGLILDIHGIFSIVAKG
ncbi:MAG: chemotaxis protein CheA [Desulfobacteraceae bacterium]|nr:chemotaxis protein CheA [Desulfobacteraceae bacterium]